MADNPHLARLARNHGVEYRGGPVCWDCPITAEPAQVQSVSPSISRR